jgi:hypothetical protein
MTRMFGDVNVKSISFDYDVVSRDTSWSGGKMLVGVRVWPDIRLLYQGPGEEPFMLWVHDEHMDFKFVGRGSCSDCWAVFSVEEFPFNPTRDKTFGMALTEPSSWGSVKALFAQ